MARVTVAQLLERIEALEAEVARLSGQQVQLVAEIVRPAPISQPIDFVQMSMGLSAQHSYYDETTGWGGYL